jgi:hypothetical protein
MLAPRGLRQVITSDAAAGIEPEGDGLERDGPDGDGPDGDGPVIA